MKVQYNYNKRYNLMLYLLEKNKKIKLEYDTKYNLIAEYKSIIQFVMTIPQYNYNESILSDVFSSEYSIDIKYNDLMNILTKLNTLELDSLNEVDQIVLYGILYSSTIFVNLIKSNKLGAYPKVVEFYRRYSEEKDNDIKEYEKNKREGIKDSGASFSIGLPEGYKVVCRFPPEPSGYLHIGHAKAALLNLYFSTVYSGELIIRMDDTNPNNEKEEYEKSIMEDLKLLGIEKYTFTRSSNHFDELLEYCKTLIRKSLAYCDDTPVEEMRHNRDKGIPSKRRDSTPEENLMIFNKLIEGPEYDQYCVRAKISVDDLNKAMRDPVIYRVNTTPHHHVGTKYRVYPTYDFVCPILDSIEGITLALRTNEYRDRNPQYMWFISALDLVNRPIIWDFSRLNFKKTVLSKRKLKWFVDHHKVSGWDDPRMPTIRGILRKGLCKEALKEYIILQGPSKNTVLLEWDKLWSINAHHIDKRAIRIHGIESSDALKAQVEGYTDQIISAPERVDRHISKHLFISKIDSNGIQINDTVTLMGAGTFKVTSLNPITFTPITVPPKNTKYKLTWVPENSHQITKIVEYGDLITVDKPEDKEPYEMFNEDSKHQQTYFCDERINQIHKGEYVQIERRGFFICDSTESGYTFNLVPGTKQNKE
ncbi:glutamyl-tRNA synthetase [Nematocida sp. AWRm80]|nr:glutamyl-tRNA synthetase [Nematocida sp. AWRm80]